MNARVDCEKIINSSHKLDKLQRNELTLRRLSALGFSFLFLLKKVTLITIDST